MGFKNVMKKVGKVALKVAPYAALAIPGIGIPAAMAISAASKVADKKIEGASWKNSLIQGGIAGGLAGVGAGALKGIGPSSGVLSKIGAGATGKVAGTGAAGKAGAILGNMAISKATSGLDRADYNKQAERRGDESYSSGSGARTAPLSAASGVMPRGGYSYDENPMNQVDQSSPNLAQSIFQGRQQAIKNQPFRRGYDVVTQIGEPDEEGKYENRVSRMPRIYSDNNRRGGSPLANRSAQAR